jgi:long-chain acyl-CoA synthetase
MIIQRQIKYKIISTNNRTEWNIMDIVCYKLVHKHFPLQFLKMITEYILNHFGANLLFCTSAEILRKINLIRDKIPNVKEVLTRMKGCQN